MSSNVRRCQPRTLAEKILILEDNLGGSVSSLAPVEIDGLTRAELHGQALKEDNDAKGKPPISERLETLAARTIDRLPGGSSSSEVPEQLIAKQVAIVRTEQTAELEAPREFKEDIAEALGNRELARHSTLHLINRVTEAHRTAQRVTDIEAFRDGANAKIAEQEAELIELRAFKKTATATIAEQVPELNALRQLKAEVHADGKSYMEKHVELIALREFRNRIAGNVPEPTVLSLEQIAEAVRITFASHRVLDETAHNNAKELFALREFKAKTEAGDAAALETEKRIDAELISLREFRARVVDELELGHPEDDDILAELRKLNDPVSEPEVDELLALREFKAKHDEGLSREAAKFEAVPPPKKYRVEYVANDGTRMIAGPLWSARQEAVDWGKHATGGKAFEVTDTDGRVWDSVGAREKPKRTRKPKEQKICQHCGEPDPRGDRHGNAQCGPKLPPIGTPEEASVEVES